MKSLHFPVKGVGGFNLILSDISVVVAIVSSAIVSFIGVSKYRVSLGQGFVVSVGVEVRCKDTGAFVGETTLLLDFRTLRPNVQQSVLECSLPKTIVRSRGRSFV
jgi:hypothetical protein